MSREKQRLDEGDPFLSDMRWPGVSVDSSEFQKLPESERLYQLARAFLKSALTLCESAGDLGAELDWPRASVCYYCLHLSTELFLKACIYRVKGRPKRLSHEVPDLLKQYKTLLPGKDFSFRTLPLWSISAKDLEDIGSRAEPPNSIHRVPDQLYRYGMDKQGNALSGIHAFTPEVLFDYMQGLDERWEQIWKKIETKDDC